MQLLPPNRLWVVPLIAFTLAQGVLPPLSAQMLTRSDLQQQIDLYEKALSRINPSGLQTLRTGRIRLRLGVLYQDAGLYGKSEDAYQDAIRSFRNLPDCPLDLAAAIDGLGTLYLQIGKIEEAEHAELKALKIREKAGEKPDLARSWNHLAALYLRKREAKPARDFAQRAVDELRSEPDASADEKISALFALSLSLGLSHDYPTAMQTLDSALQLVRATYRPNDFLVGLGTFLLGYTHWKEGEVVRAGELMREGTENMSRQLGWWSPVYRSVMLQYARFLRSTHRKDEAKTIEQNAERARSEANADPSYRRNQETIDAAAFF